jgi:PAS domain S-box-containing protein
MINPWGNRQRLREQQLEAELAQVKSACALQQLVINSMRDGMLALNAQGRLVLGNDAAAALLDLTGEPPAPHEWPARYGLHSPGTDRMLEPHEVPVARVLAGEAVHDVDIDIRGTGGQSARTVRCSFVPMTSEVGVAAAMVVMRDISDLRELQAEQSRSVAATGELQRKLVEAQETGRLGNWELDLASQKLWWSDEVHELLGVPKAGFDGSIATLLAAIHPDDRSLFMRERSHALRKGELLETEYRVVLPRGDIRWIHHIGRHFAATAARPARRAGVMQDITSRKQADSELLLLRNAVNRLNDMVIITRADPVTGTGPEIVYVNDSFVKSTGYGSAEVIGMTPRILQGPRTDRAALDRIRHALEHRRAVREELVNYRRDGTPFWVEIDISPLRDDRAVVTHFIAVQRDTTTRKLAGQALLASERRYAALFENAPLPMWVATEDGSAFLAVNDAMQKQYGYSQEEFSRLSLFDLRPPSEHARLARRLALPASERRTDAFWTHQRKDGSIFEVEVMTTSVGHMGKPAVFAIVNDISARVRAEREVQLHVLSLERLAAASQAIASRQTLDTIAEELALFARDILGCDRAEFLVAEMMATCIPVNPPDTAGDTRSLLDVPVNSASGKCLGLLRLSGKSGGGSFTQMDRHLAAELAQAAASSMEKALLIDDVSALNASLELRVANRTAQLEEQRAMFSALAEDSPQIVWMVDKDGAVTYMNRSWYELTGTSAPEGLGHSWTQYIHPDDLAAMQTNWAQSRAAGTLFTGQRRFRAQDGRYRTMAYRAALVVSAGRATFWVGVDADITDIKATEEALRRSNAELEAFSYTVSHDLRSPLAAIDGFSKLLARHMGENQSPKARHYLDRMGAGIARMGQLIEAMLFLAQVSRSQMHWTTVDISAMAREIVAELREGEPQRSVSVLIEDDLVATADPRLLQVILQNLLGNAWKFSSRTSAAVLGLTREPDGSFCVKDNGVGFDMTYGNKLFGTFERLHSEADFPGTGIGLASVKRAVERHGGRIRAESEPGVSTRFYFTLSEVTLTEGTPLEVIQPRAVEPVPNKADLATEDAH